MCPELLDEVLEILLYCDKHKKPIGYLAAEVVRLIDKHRAPTSVEAAREPMTAQQFETTLSQRDYLRMTRYQFAEAYLANYRAGEIKGNENPQPAHTENGLSK